MLHIFDAQAAHIYWNSGILIGGFFLCLLVGIGGALYRRFSAREKAYDLMYPGSAFPTPADVILTVVFLAYYTFSLILPDGSDSVENESLLMVMLTSLIYQALFYSPMILRMALLPHNKNIAAPIEAKLPPLDQKSSWASLSGLKRDILLAFITVFGTIVFSFFYEISGLPMLLSETTGSPKNQWVVDMFIQGQPGLCILIAFAAVIIAPIGEECCFRGFLYNSLKKYSGRVVAMICSSLLFAAVHMALNSILPLIVFAMLQCFIYQKSKSLRAPIIAHAMFNFTELLLIILFPDIT